MKFSNHIFYWAGITLLTIGGIFYWDWIIKGIDLSWYPIVGAFIAIHGGLVGFISHYIMTYRRFSGGKKRKWNAYKKRLKK